MNFSAEIARYDTNCRVGRWRGPSGWITYRTLGIGPGLIVIPGIASTYRGYAALLNRLAPSVFTIIFDYPGDNADDEADLAKIGHQDLVDNVIGLGDHLELERPALFGPSFGSTVLLGALIQAPERFNRSVVQGGFVHRHLGAVERLALSIGRRIPGTLASLPFREAILAVKNQQSFQGEAADRWPIYLEQNGLTPIGPLSHRLDLVARLDLRERLRSLPTEVLAVQGEDDRVIGRSQWLELCESVPNATGMHLKGVGHQPHYSHPEELASIIENWVLRGTC